MKVVSIDSIIEKSARLWHTYHRLGKTRVDRVGPKLLHFVVVEYPGLPENFQECMCGYISQVLELAGGTAVRVSHGAIGSGQWCWKLSWC